MTRGFFVCDRRGRRLGLSRCSHQEALELAKEMIEKDRAFACGLLDAAVIGKRELVARLRQAHEAGEVAFDDPGLHAVTSIRLVEQVEFVGDEIRFRPSVEHTHDRDQAILYMALSIARIFMGEQTVIGRCQLESCRRFFIIERGKIGRPQTDYCCEEHRLEQHSLQAAERQRRSRENRRKAAGRPRRAK